MVGHGGIRWQYIQVIWQKKSDHGDAHSSSSRVRPGENKSLCGRRNTMQTAEESRSLSRKTNQRLKPWGRGDGINCVSQRHKSGFLFNPEQRHIIQYKLLNVIWGKAEKFMEENFLKSRNSEIPSGPNRLRTSQSSNRLYVVAKLHS